MRYREVKAQMEEMGWEHIGKNGSGHETFEGPAGQKMTLPTASFNGRKAINYLSEAKRRLKQSEANMDVTKENKSLQPQLRPPQERAPWAAWQSAISLMEATGVDDRKISVSAITGEPFGGFYFVKRRVTGTEKSRYGLAKSTRFIWRAYDESSGPPVHDKNYAAYVTHEPTRRPGRRDQSQSLQEELEALKEQMAQKEASWDAEREEFFEVISELEAAVAKHEEGEPPRAAPAQHASFGVPHDLIKRVALAKALHDARELEAALNELVKTIIESAGA